MHLVRHTFLNDARIYFELMTMVSTNGPQKDLTQDVEERVIKVIALTKRLPRETVTLNSSFESLGVDSLDRLNILFDLESEFDIEINDEDAKRVENIPQMIAGVVALLEAKAGGGAASFQAPSVPPAHVSESPSRVSGSSQELKPIMNAATKPASSGE